MTPHGNLRATGADGRCSATPCSALLAEWDDLVTRTPGTDVTQLSVWGHVRAMEGFRPRWLFARRRDRLVGGAQVLLRGLPGLGLIGYVPYGPLVDPGVEHRGDVVRELAAALAGLRNVRMLFVQPPEGGDDLRQELHGQGFRPSDTHIAPVGSVRLDLSRSLEDIRKGLNPRLRSWTRRWPDHGVTVRRGDERDVPLLARLMGATAAARGYAPPPREDYLRHVYAELAPRGHAALFVGEVDGTPVTADLVTICGSMVRGRFAGFDRSGPGARLSVPGAARWEITRWAKESGYRWLDFGGLTEQTLHDLDDGRRWCESWPGPDKAKLSFGGEPFRYPEPVELIRPAALRKAFDAAKDSRLGRCGVDRVRIWMQARRQQRAPSGPVSALPAAEGALP
jgi:lipid II:glycine glycyltransferase (peptidoglycan interpeptide bridge formation enzyme)